MNSPCLRLAFFYRPWVNALPMDHPIKTELFSAIRKNLNSAYKIRDVNTAVAAIAESGSVSMSSVREMDLGRGVVAATLELPHELFYHYHSANNPDLTSRTTGTCFPCCHNCQKSSANTTGSIQRFRMFVCAATELLCQARRSCGLKSRKLSVRADATGVRLKARCSVHSYDYGPILKQKSPQPLAARNLQKKSSISFCRNSRVM